MRIGWSILVALSLGGIAACGSDKAAPITHSTLPATVPTVNQLQLTQALPKPADFGPGWTFDTTSLGDIDLIGDYALTPIARMCKGARPKDAGTTTFADQRLSETMLAPDGPGYVWVRLMVDSPAAAADRLALLRAAFTGCGKVKYTANGAPFTETFKILDLPPVNADETLAVRITDEANDGTHHTVETWALARAGGLILALVGKDGADPLPLLPTSMQLVRQRLHL